MYLEIKDVKKSYGQDGSYVQVLKGINTGLEKGQMCVIQGTSGSGKSTLLNCIGGLDIMDSGTNYHISTPKTEAGCRRIPMINEVYEAFLEEFA